MLKIRGSILTLVIAGSLLLTSMAGAHPYDRNNSDNPLRFVVYPIHAVGIITEYVLLRPIHALVSQPNLDILFGHDTLPGREAPLYKWEKYNGI